ncbi:MAG: ABC transporter ATP-binding protein [Candidatus Tectimicrobiota bacterium]|nr:MAG: ABC transporter ATP-binding protein [Candidatus Tectomicrobia bacterium]
MLELHGVHTYYGKSHILHGIDLQVAEGEVVTLLGRNGAGKTTTLRSIMGLTPPRRGEVRFCGKALTGMRPYEISRLGLGYVPENRLIFTELTVLENLTIAWRPGHPWTIERVLDTFPGLAARRTHRGRALSGGEQQMLAIARTLVNGPRLILLDEPSEGLAPLIVQAIKALLLELKREGVTLLVAEQNLELCLAVADRHYIIDQGVIRYQGTTQDLRRNRQVQEAFLGV